MRIIVCGMGQVGRAIAGRLSRDKHSVTIVEDDPALLAEAEAAMDVRAALGHGAHPDVLERAGAANADMVIAATVHDEVNVMICQVARRVFGRELTIARVRHHGYVSDPRLSELIDAEHVVSPETEIGKAALARLDFPRAFQAVVTLDGAGALLGLRVDAENPLADTPARAAPDLLGEGGATLAALGRDGALHFPRGDELIQPGDEAYVFAPATRAASVARALGSGEESDALDGVVVVAGGGGRTARFVAQELERRARERGARLRLRLIEQDRRLALETAEAVPPNVIVIHGDALDAAIQREAGVAEAEAFFALTGSDETNLIAAAIARRAGCRQTACRLNSPHYAPITRPLGVDAWFSARAITVSAILAHVRRAHGAGVRRVHTILDGEGEVVEGVALRGAPVETRALGELAREAGGGAVVCAARRLGEFLPISDDLRLEAGDSVVILASKAQASAAASWLAPPAGRGRS